jgi:nitroreductase
MNKNSGNRIHKDIINRKSIVAFSDKDINQDDLELLFEAAKWAPSSRNQQPWRFIYARKNMKEYEVLFDLLNDTNKLWAGNAPVLVLSIAETISSYKQRPNYYAFHDLGLAMGNFLLQATSLGIYVHQMGGFDKDRAKSDLNLPDGFEPGAMIAIGYPGDVENIPEEVRHKDSAERKRKKLDEFVFKGKWHGL